MSTGHAVLLPRAPARATVLACAALLAAFLATESEASARALPRGSGAPAFEAAPVDSGSPDLIFESVWGDSFGAGEEPLEIVHIGDERNWRRAPFGDQLITDPDAWGDPDHSRRTALEVDYNRVDRLRLGARFEWQGQERMNPRLGVRLGYAFDRKTGVYGVQIEQPIVRPGRIALGVSMLRFTDHSELHQVDDFENTLALLFFRQDFRDYFEREGADAYLSWRVPDFSTVSLHLRQDRYRTLPTQWGTRSWFNRDDPLRENPAIDDGDAVSWVLRLERMAQRTSRTRPGFYHWIELARAGHGLGGDFSYTRLLADGRGVFRLTPGTTLAVRGVAGASPDDSLPAQKEFTAGGVDGLRAHPFAEFRGNQIALAQLEYSLSLWELHRGRLQGGIQALAFLDAGRAWSNPSGSWDVGRQPLAADAGFGLATEDDGVRIYFAKDLHSDSDFVVSLRLQRPF